MDELLSQVESTIEKYKMLRRGERVFVACSGGPDSVALFHILRELAPRLGIRLHLLHFDHALRRGSAKDREFVRRLAVRFHTPFYSGRRKSKGRALEKNLSPEEAARQMRYDFFRKAARRLGVRKIALAHQRDDQAETVLMRLIQGAGPRGLGGIRPVVETDGVTSIRPLLWVSRRQILKFLKSRSLEYREDPTNRSTQFLRNRIRHKLLPLLEKEFNPRASEILCRIADSTNAESQGLDEWVKENWRHFIRSKRNGTIWLRRNPLLSLPSPLQFRLLDKFLHLLDSQSGLDFRSWEKIAGGIRRGRYRASLPRNIDVQLTPKKLFIRKSDTITTG